MADIRQLNEHFKLLEDQYETWMPQWLDIKDLMEPHRGRFNTQTYNDQNDGKTQTDKRIDGSATLALRTLASGMQGGLTSPSQKWFRTGLLDQELSKYAPVREWLDTVENIMYQQFRRSNFYTSTINIYREEGAFGTACLFPELDNTGTGIWNRQITIGDFYLATDGQGKVNTLYRRDYMTAKQLLDMFGAEVLSLEVTQALTDYPYKYFEIIHAVRPREERDSSKIDKFNKSFESVYWEKHAREDEQFLSEGGFNEFPFMVPRWDVVGSNVFGYSPGMEALPDVKALQAISEDLMIAVNKVVDPPLNVSAEIFDNIDTLPGGRNPVNGAQQVTPTYQINPSVRDGDAFRQVYSDKVNDWFYVPLFTLLTNPNATATEVAKKAEEQLIQLGPVIQRQFSEFLTPYINRAFNLLWDQGMFPDPPPEIEGQDIEIEYISTLAQAQKQIGVDKLERHVAFVGQLAGVQPDVLDVPDWDFIVREHANGIGVPQKAHNDDREVDEIRLAREQQMLQAQQQQQMAQAAQTAATASNAKLDDKNVLSELVGGAGGEEATSTG